MILLLEDARDRLDRFGLVLARLAPNVPVRAWPDARAMIREVGPHLASARLVSLDHDLVQAPGMPDPGDGLDVARFLATQRQPRPTIVHSSNAERAALMVSCLRQAGWPCSRVAPIGDDWIEADWAAVAQRLLGMVPTP